jgi:hypothetical protein
LSDILKRFIEQLGTNFTDSDHIRDDIAPKVAPECLQPH